MIFVWFLIVLLLVLVELFTRNFTSIWFAASAALALILTFVTDIFVIQFSIFVVFGIIFLVIIKPMLKQKLDSKYLDANKDKIIGSKALVIEEINKNKNGLVKLESKIFMACANEKIKKNTYVDISAIDGVKLIVCKKGKVKNEKE